MSSETRGNDALGSTLCAEKTPQNYSSQKKRIDKKAGEKSWLGTFNRWIADEANGYCESGLCSTGTCKGHLKDAVSVKLLTETNDYIEVKFEVTIYCKCG
ncbi:hypothetical protein [Kangiella sp. HZ709]|uniref:hypothetical protein n=1 Tax=Kangiella sp. HZ709 TaxID=2666328 RepID=UPI0012B09108|nr:hypothetical protein [Kangiella sp. HZ709]MRX28175.1 hypothetical protein [Kangiella sp. HZ709]